MKFDRACNGLARLFGLLATLAGVAFLVSAYAIAQNRALNIAIGIFAIAMGVAFLWTKPVDAEQLAGMRQRKRRSD
jgi:uncharacterized membrane protein HdeD (DUF308 family)